MTTPLKTTVLIVLAVVIVGIGAYALFTQKALSPADTADTAGNRYVNERHGFSFSYPDGYVLSEQEAGTVGAGHYQIMLVAEENAEIPESGEGPIAVTVDVYQNDTAEQTALDWITNAPESNFGLGNGEYVGADVAGRDGYSYTWSGLYEGRTTAFANEDDIITVSATWMTPEDSTLDAYREVVETFRFEDDVLGEQKG